MEQHAADMAAFCLATGIPPSEYRKLYPYEVNAFIERYNKINKR